MILIAKQLNIFTINLVLFYQNFHHFYLIFAGKIIEVPHLNPLVLRSIATLLHGIGTSVKQWC